MQTRAITVGRKAADGKLLLLPGASVALYETGTSYGTLASGVTDADGNPANPITADANAQAVIAAPNGTYDVRITPTDGGATIDKPGQVWSDVAELADQVAADAEQTTADRAQTGVDRAAAEAAAASADVSAQAAQNTRGLYPTTANALSDGVAALASPIAGSGGTDGTFDLAFSGGAGSNAAGRFVVAAGVVVSWIITYPGYGYTSAPTVSFAASAGLTGASATAVIAQNVTPGQYFTIPDDDDSGTTQLWQNVAGVATDTGKRAASALAIAAETTAREALATQVNADIANPDFAWGVLDDAGTVGLGLRANGETSADLDEASANRALSKPADYKLLTQEDARFAWGVVDDGGNVGIGIDRAGNAVANLDTQSAQKMMSMLGLQTGAGRFTRYLDNAYGQPARYWYDESYGVSAAEPADRVLRLVVHIGQSLSVGGNNSYPYDPPDATVSKIPVYPEYCLMLNTGARGAQSTAVDVSAINYFAPIVETYSDHCGETQGSGMLNAMQTALVAEQDLSRTWLYRSDGSGGKHIYEINKSTNPYNNTLAELARIKQIAALYGWTIVVAGIVVTHGEQDRSSTTYGDDLAQLISDYRSDIPPITEQASVIPFFIDQVTAGNIDSNASGSAHAGPSSQGQLAVVDGVSDCYLTHPKYWCPFLDGDVHLMPMGYELAGEKTGQVLKRVLVDEGSWSPLRATAAVLSGSTITVDFDIPVGPLAFDTTIVPAQADYGFRVRDADGDVAITSVDIVGDQVVIVCASAPGATPRLWYAYADTTANNDVTKKWGNLRDSDPQESFKYPGTHLYDWCVCFDIEITE